MTDESVRLTSRHTRILSILRQTGFQTVSDLAAKTQVSDMTIRRDLRALEDAGELRVVHGGATIPVSTPHGGYEARAIAHASAKQHIGRTAAASLTLTDTIGIDAGTTAHEVALALDDRFTGTVVTCSVPVIQTLMNRPEIHLIGTGGDLLRSSQAFVGPSAVESIQRLRFTTVFLGAGSLTSDGLYVATDLERPTKLALMESASTVVVLMDSSKFQQQAPVKLCDWSRVDALVTERTPPKEVADAMREAGADLLVAAAASQ